MLQTIREAQVEAQIGRRKPFHLQARYFFVERDPQTFAFLKDTLEQSEFSKLLDTEIVLIEGAFIEQLGNILPDIKRRQKAHRSIFLLDQCGYAEAPMDVLRRIMRGLQSPEIILTFAVDSLIDYMTDQPAFMKAMSNTKLGVTEEEIRNAKENIEGRRKMQFLLHDRIPKMAAAEFYTPFFIRSAEAHRDYWLIHLSRHHRARDVMVQLHWEKNTSFLHLGGSGLNMLGYDPNEDFALTRQHLLPSFEFDAIAQDSTLETLVEDVPRRLSDIGNVSFEQLFQNVSNECPATSKQLKEVIQRLAKDGIVTVQSADASTTRREGIQHDTDLVLLHKQTRFFFS